MLHMYKFLCIGNDLLMYITMYKISQNHLELIFSSIRSHSGYNNNPTIKKFKFAFKKLIIHTEIKENNIGNCIPLEDISILHIPSTIDSFNIINATSNQNSNKNWLNVFETTHSDHDYFLYRVSDNIAPPVMYR